MATYRIEEEEEPSLGFQIILYAIMFTILIPIGVIYLIVKLIIWLVKRHKQKKMEEEVARVELANSRQAVHSETVNRMLDLKRLHDNGLLTKEEYQEALAKEKAILIPKEPEPEKEKKTHGLCLPKFGKK